VGPHQRPGLALRSEVSCPHPIGSGNVKIPSLNEDSPESSVPGEITNAILHFCSLIVPDGTPRFVPVVLGKHSQDKACHFNVVQQTADYAGSAVAGWSICLDQHGNLESLFHSVWRNPTGELIDVTPAPHGSTRTLFLEDPSREFMGYYVGGHALVPRENMKHAWPHLLRAGLVDLEFMLHPRFGGSPRREYLKQVCRLFAGKPCWCGCGKPARECKLLRLTVLGAPKALLIRPSTIEPVL
jgi:hypothetical protein